MIKILMISIRGNKLKVLKFTASWCKVCPSVSATFDAIKDDIKIDVVDVDVDSNYKIAQDMRVKSLPAIVLVDDNGAEIKRHFGSISSKELLTFLGL